MKKTLIQLIFWTVFSAAAGNVFELEIEQIKAPGIRTLLEKLFTDAERKLDRSTAPVQIHAGLASDKKYETLLNTHLSGRKLKLDGYAVIVKRREVHLIGNQENSLIVAAADFLERQCGYYRAVRPMDDGTPGTKLNLKDAAWVRNPAFELRNVASFGYILNKQLGQFQMDATNWQMINGYNYFPFHMSTEASYLKRLELGLPLYNSGHTFYYWLPGSLYKDHPEYFPLVKGKRMRYEKLNYSTKYQINVGNKEVQELVAQRMIEYARNHPGIKMLSLGMNDGAIWCESPESRSMDDEDEFRRGVYSTRYYRFCNIVAEKVAKVFPDLKIHTYAYLTCVEPPKLEKLHPNLWISLCTYRRDYKHTINDPSAPVNVYWNNIIKGWKKFGNPIYIRDYLLFGGAPAFDVPLLKILQKDLQYYRKVGVEGYGTECRVDGPKSNATAQELKGYYRNPPENHELYWTGMKMEFFLLSKLLWDPDADLARLKQDYFKAYYGPAAGPMEKISRRIEERWDADPAPYIWNKYDTNFPAMLFKKGDLEYLEEQVAEAEKIAAASGDAELKIRIAREKKLITGEYRKRYAGGTRKDLTVKSFHGEITPENIRKFAIANQSVIPNLVTRIKNKKKKLQVRPSANPAKIYCAVQGDNLIICADFQQGKPVSATKQKRDGFVWKGNDTLELFIGAGPQKSKDGYYQLIFNPCGDVYDACLSNKAWNCGVKAIATSRQNNWFVLAIIPLKDLGYPEKEKSFPVRMNFGRNVSGSEISSWTDGSFANESAFGTLNIER